jgi:hypothetical protein
VVVWGVRMAKMVEALGGNWHRGIEPWLPHHGSWTWSRRGHTMRIKWRRGPVECVREREIIIMTLYHYNYSLGGLQWGDFTLNNNVLSGNHFILRNTQYTRGHQSAKHVVQAQIIWNAKFSISTAGAFNQLSSTYGMANYCVCK